MLSDLLRGPLFPVGGRGGCDVTYGGGGVRAVAPRRRARLRRDGGGRHVADQPRAALHLDVRMPLGGHVEDAEAVVVETRQLALEHACTPFASPNTHRCLAVEDGQLATYTDTGAHRRKKTHTRHTQAYQEGRRTDTHASTVTRTSIPVVTYVHKHTHTRVFECYTIHHPSRAMVRVWDR